MTFPLEEPEFETALCFGLTGVTLNRLAPLATELDGKHLYGYGTETGYNIQEENDDTDDSSDAKIIVEVKMPCHRDATEDWN